MSCSPIHGCSCKKIQELETKFDQAHDWANNTGQGVKEQDGQETFENMIRQHCRWYFDLLPIMGDGNKASPSAATDDLLESDAESRLSNSVVEVATKRKSDASSRASTKTSQKPLPTPPAKTQEEYRRNWLYCRLLVYQSGVTNN